MELVYVFHSGFAVLSDKASLLFDYYEDTDKDHGFVHEELLKRPEPLYVFSSHFHQDHFSAVQAGIRDGSAVYRGRTVELLV